MKETNLHHRERKYQAKQNEAASVKIKAYTGNNDAYFILFAKRCHKEKKLILLFFVPKGTEISLKAITMRINFEEPTKLSVVMTTKEQLEYEETLSIKNIKH